MANQFISFIGGFKERTEEQIRQRMVRVATMYERLWQEIIREGNSTLSTARKFEHLGGLKSSQYLASQPGYPPAIQTGALVKGITHTIEKTGPMEYQVRIGESIESGRGSPQGSAGRSIAEMLEFGTSTMAPRPSWRPAFIRLREEASTIVQGRLREHATPIT